MAQEIMSYRDLFVWQKGMDLVDLVYDLAETFPRKENFRLVDQITRSVVSVPANIAEGQGRQTSRDFGHFLSLARSSLFETETHLLIALRRKYITKEDADPALALCATLSKMLVTLRKRILDSRRKVA